MTEPDQSRRRTRVALVIALLVLVALIVAVAVPLAIGVHHGDTVKLPPAPSPTSKEPQ